MNSFEFLIVTEGFYCLRFPVNKSMIFFLFVSFAKWTYLFLSLVSSAWSALRDSLRFDIHGQSPIIRDVITCTHQYHIRLSGLITCLYLCCGFFSNDVYLIGSGMTFCRLFPFEAMWLGRGLVLASYSKALFSCLEYNCFANAFLS